LSEAVGEGSSVWAVWKICNDFTQREKDPLFFLSCMTIFHYVLILVYSNVLFKGKPQQRITYKNCMQWICEFILVKSCNIRWFLVLWLGQFSSTFFFYCL